jgi:hypothetical protein
MYSFKKLSVFRLFKIVISSFSNLFERRLRSLRSSCQTTFCENDDNDNNSNNCNNNERNAMHNVVPVEVIHR